MLTARPQQNVQAEIVLSMSFHLMQIAMWGMNRFPRRLALPQITLVLVSHLRDPLPISRDTNGTKVLMHLLLPPLLRLPTRPQYQRRLPLFHILSRLWVFTSRSPGCNLSLSSFLTRCLLSQAILDIPHHLSGYPDHSRAPLVQILVDRARQYQFLTVACFQSVILSKFLLELSLTGHLDQQPFVPYPAYSTLQQPSHQQGNGQAPLVPTGFIQGEQGILIPLYQPEALDQYNTTGNQQTPTPTWQPSAQHPTAWRQYPQVPTYHYIPGQPPAHQGNVGWTSNPPGSVVFPAGQHTVTPSFRGRNNQHHTPTRRNRQVTYDRNFSHRPSQRYGAGGMLVNSTGQAFNSDQGVSEPVRSGTVPSHPVVSSPGASWGQWTGAR